MRKTYKPITPSRRHMKRLVGRESGVIDVPKYLRIGKKKTGGRNNNGRITSFHRGGGFKQNIRLVD
jgi:large subunit ribosomal protein L2